MKLRIALVASFLGIVPAPAADLAYKAAPLAPMRPLYDWSGFYLGINGGGGWSNNCLSMNGALGFGFDPAIDEGCNNGKGAVVGGQIGYRYQAFGSWVFGLEAQGDWADLTGSNGSNVFTGLGAAFPGVARFMATPGLNVGLVNASKVDAIGLFTGQIGYAVMPTLLWYVKGGAAATNNKYDGALGLSFSRAGVPIFSLAATDHAERVRFGGTIGTGLEWAFADGWSIGGEYNHLFMGSQDVGFALTSFETTPAVVLPKAVLAPGMPTRNDAVNGDIDMATIRLNYRFYAR